jgi:hypothetical protein
MGDEFINAQSTLDEVRHLIPENALIIISNALMKGFHKQECAPAPAPHVWDMHIEDFLLHIDVNTKTIAKDVVCQSLWDQDPAAICRIFVDASKNLSNRLKDICNEARAVASFKFGDDVDRHLMPFYRDMDESDYEVYHDHLKRFYTEIPMMGIGGDVMLHTYWYHIFVFNMESGLKLSEDPKEQNLFRRLPDLKAKYDAEQLPSGFFQLPSGPLEKGCRQLVLDGLPKITQVWIITMTLRYFANAWLETLIRTGNQITADAVDRFSSGLHVINSKAVVRLRPDLSGLGFEDITRMEYQLPSRDLYPCILQELAIFLCEFDLDELLIHP